MKRSRHCLGGAAWRLLAALAGLASLVWWNLDGARERPAQAQHTALTAAATPAASAAPAARTPAEAPGQAAVVQRQRELALWQRRLETAQRTLQGYSRSTRYPPEARLLSEHADQAYPNLPIVEDAPLRLADGSVARGVRVRTTQERVFVQGNESVQLSVSLHAPDGTVLPLRIVRAVAREVPLPNTGSLFPATPLNFNDQGVDGDVHAGDGVHGVRLQPARQGFAGLTGTLRTEVVLQLGGQEALVYFDLVLTGKPPAAWTGVVREAMEEGSLNFYLGAEVRQPGQYIVRARVDDARGHPVALLTFNDEVAAGSQEFRLSLFGKLVRDTRPAFPLALRDVEAFLLKPDSFPDRAMLARRAGVVHVSASHPLDAFSPAEWHSEERDRHLGQLQRDVDEARSAVARLQAQR